MSGENKQGEKLKSTLSADVPPFIPRNYNLGLLSDTFTTENEIHQIPQYDAFQARESKWHVPMVPPSSSGIMLFHITPYVPTDYRFQSAQGDEVVLQPSHFPTANNNFPPKGKKRYNQKHLEGRSTATVNENNACDNSLSCAPTENDRRQKDTSNHFNSMRKSNHGRYNVDREKSSLKLKIPHETLSSPVKLDNTIEFPSLPTASNKDNNQNQSNSESCQPAQVCSYSSILKSSPKHSSDLNQKTSLSVNNNCIFRDTEEERMLHQNTHRKQKQKKTYEAKKKHIHNEEGRKPNSAIENEKNDNLKIIKNDKNCIYQAERNIGDQKQSSSKAVESVIEKSKSLPKKHFRDNRESSQILESPNRSADCSKEVSSVTDQTKKPQKCEKKRKRNKKKKKADPGKVSLLSPEMFANITNKLNEASKVNQNDSFNLCDQDFPDLGPSSSLTLIEENGGTEKHTVGGLKESNTSSNEKPLNLWKPTTYSDILQTAKVRNNEKEIETSAKSMKESSSNSKTEDTVAIVPKKKEKKKKKKSSAASGSSKKVQADGKQTKPDSVIQISLASIVTSLQQVKLNQMRKKEAKTRVISTKRGIMDKMANPHNMLDSSAPMKKRGKEREKPGRKRLSAMRKIILREREKRRMRLLEAAKFISEDDDDGASKETSDTSADVSVLQTFADTCEKVDGTLQASKIILHTKKFRDYCDHMISEEIDSTVLSILRDLVRFQDRLHEKDPIKARMKRRLVYGLREVTKHLRLCKIKCIIIAPNIEKISSEGGLSDVLQVIIKIAQEQRIPYVFALQRRVLGKVCMKIVPVSCIGIFNYEGVEENYRKLLEFLTEAREKYNETLKLIGTYVTEDIKAQLLQADISPAEIQLIRSEVLSKISMSENTPSEEPGLENNTEESNMDENIDSMLERISVEDKENLIQNKEINSE